MYNIKQLITSLFDAGFDVDSINKISQLLNNDVTANIIKELEDAKVHKLAVSNFNKTLLAQNKQISDLKSKLTIYEDKYACVTHDRSANPWRHNVTHPDQLDYLGDEVSCNGYMVDRITGVKVTDKYTGKVKKSSENNLPEPTIIYDSMNGINDNDVDDIIKSDEYQLLLKEAKERKRRDEEAQRMKAKAAKLQKEIDEHGLPFATKKYEDDQPPISIKSKNVVKKKATKNVVKKKATKKATKKVTKKATKK